TIACFRKKIILKILIKIRKKMNLIYEQQNGPSKTERKKMNLISKVGHNLVLHHHILQSSRSMNVFPNGIFDC
ncbi:hypothetical protein ACJX0J_012027, partial [Zea mays]